MRHLQFTAYVVAACLCVSAQVSSAGEAPLADAAEKDNARAIRDLLSAKANVNAPQADGMTALHWAVQHEDVAAVEMLLAGKADVQAKNRYGVTPLAIACTTGSGPIVEKLLAAGADANAAL